MQYEQAIKQLFERFYSKFYKTSYNLDLDHHNNRKLITNFIDALVMQYTHSVGINLIIDYFCFAFEYWSSKATKRNISLNWIVGSKMLQRFVERRDSYQYYYHKFLVEHQIDIDQIRTSLVENREDRDYLQVHQSEEMEKSRFPDTEGRLYNCLQTTTLFNHRSVICLTCHQRKACRQLLANTNPDINQNRGYAEAQR